MKEYRIEIDPELLVDWILAEKDAAGGKLTFFEQAKVEFDVEEEFDRAAFGLGDGEDYDLVTATAVLDVEPHVEQNYWVLRIKVERDLGPVPISDEGAFSPRPIDLDSFRDDFLRAPGWPASTVLMAQTVEAKQHFDDWFAGMKRRHC